MVSSNKPKPAFVTLQLSPDDATSVMKTSELAMAVYSEHKDCNPLFCAYARGYRSERRIKLACEAALQAEPAEPEVKSK